MAALFSFFFFFFIREFGSTVLVLFAGSTYNQRGGMPYCLQPKAQSTTVMKKKKKTVGMNERMLWKCHSSHMMASKCYIFITY